MGGLNACSFDRISPYYPHVEFLVFGNMLTRARNTALDSISPAERVLLLGEGNGRFLAELLCRHPEVSVTCVEPSAAMRESQNKRLRRRLRRMPVRLTSVAKRFQDWDPGASEFDVLTAHFFLDLFSETEIADVVARMDRLAAPGARILVAEFVEGPRAVLSRALIRTMYLFFRLTSGLTTRRIPDWPREFASRGWTECCRTNYLCGLIQATEWRRSTA